MDEVSHRPARRSRLSRIGSEPDYRYSLANERTFLSWIRTSLALIAAGVAFVQFAEDFGSKFVRVIFGVILVLAAAVIAAMSHRRWWLRERAMRLDEPLPPSHIAILLGYGMAVIAIAIVVGLVVSL